MKLNWSKIKTRSGYATKFEQYISALFSPNEIERKKANDRIDNNAIVQSDLYEAAFYVIEPILNKLLEPYSVDRYYALEVLVEIILGGNGDDTFSFPFENTQVRLQLGDAVKRKFLELKNEIAKIEVKTTKEIEDKNLILEEIDSWAGFTSKKTQ